MYAVGQTDRNENDTQVRRVNDTRVTYTGVTGNEKNLTAEKTETKKM